MTCPSCNEKAIGFIDWCGGRRAFSHACDNCGASLRATRGTWIGFALTLLLCLGVVGAMLFGMEEAPGRRDPLTYAAIGIPALIGGAITWFVGGYTAERGS